MHGFQKAKFVNFVSPKKKKKRKKSKQEIAWQHILYMTWSNIKHEQFRLLLYIYKSVK